MEKKWLTEWKKGEWMTIFKDIETPTMLETTGQ